MLIDVLLSSASLQSKLPFLLSWIVALAIALTVHEFAHAKRADLAGDPTPRSQGRVSLNPLDHYDPIGTTMILLFGIGWGKPVPVNPMLFKNPRRDGIMVALWGPLANIITAALFAIPVRFGFAGAYVHALQIVVYLNLLLAVFNLLPLGPLDGAAVVAGLLPVHKARRFQDFTARWGMILLLAVIVLRPLRLLIFLPVSVMMFLLTGSFL